MVHRTLPEYTGFTSSSLLAFQLIGICRTFLFEASAIGRSVDRNHPTFPEKLHNNTAMDSPEIGTMLNILTTQVQQLQNILAASQADSARLQEENTSLIDRINEKDQKIDELEVKCNKLRQYRDGFPPRVSTDDWGFKVLPKHHAEYQDVWQDVKKSDGSELKELFGAGEDAKIHPVSLSMNPITPFPDIRSACLPHTYYEVFNSTNISLFYLDDD